MTTFTLSTGQVFATVECCVCMTIFAMPQVMRQKRLDDHLSFYCPVGHAQSYSGQPTVVGLRAELAAAQSEKERLAAELLKAKRSLARARKVPR